MSSGRARRSNPEPFRSIPANSDLKPEKGTEIEAGFDASIFNDRMNLEVTYFDKTSKNLLLQRPLPPSLGFQQNPFVNIGEMYNRGFEVSIGGAPVRFSWFDWDSRLAFNTLDNKVVDLGRRRAVRDAHSRNGRLPAAVVGLATDPQHQR